MYHDYDFAVSYVLDYLRQNSYSPSVIYARSQSYRVFKAYMTESDITYSKEAALKWLQMNKNVWKHHKYKYCRYAIFQLNDFMLNGKISTNRFIYDDSPYYARLSGWSREILDKYLYSLSKAFKESYVNQLRISGAKFLMYLETQDIKSVDGISYKILITYFGKNSYKTVNTRNKHMGDIRQLLSFFAKQGLVSHALPYALDCLRIQNIIFLDVMTEDERALFLSDDTEQDHLLTVDEYYSVIKDLGTTYLDLYRYSKTMKKVFKKSWIDLMVFLDANGLCYSTRLMQNWVNYKKEKMSPYKSMRRAFMLLEQYIDNGDIMPQIVYSYKEDTINALPEWSRYILKRYLELKRKEGNAPSTIAMHRSSCLRLLKFLKGKGIDCCDRITPEIVQEFHLQDIHSTTEGKNAYAVRYRMFMDYLADLNMIPATLQLAMPTKIAPKTVIVRTISENEIRDIYNYKAACSSPMELRRISMVLLGLQMGLRGCDIASMKLSDISWKNATITLIQQKTKKSICLPMPVETGNCLYRYIKEGRPACNTDYVFITHRVPYERLHPSRCAHALNSVLSGGSGQRYGFHITRKTFASKLLSSKTPVNTIVDALGHSDKSTVSKYLATDEKNMRLCAISLEGIEPGGGWLW